MSEQSNDTTNAVHVPTDATVALIDAARSKWTESLQVSEAFVVAASRAAFAAKSEGLIGAGQRYENSAAFGNLFPDRDGKGASKATVTRWVRLGKCLTLGITPEEHAVLWGRLVSKVNDKRIGDAVEDPKATLTKVRNAVAKCFPGGKYASAADQSAASTDAKGAKGADPEAAVPTVPQSVSAMLDTLEAIAARMAGETLSPAEAARLGDVLETFSGITTGSLAVVEEKRSA